MNYSSTTDRRICTYKDCSNLSRNVGKNHRNETRYGNLCDRHHRLQSDSLKRESFDNRQCQKCGWDESFCDRHRINPEIGYVEGNVLILCPNCHRKETYGS